MKKRRRQLKKRRQRQRKRTRELLPYRYQRLPDEKSSIRLLELLPGAWNDEIRCRLNIVKKRPFLPYEAISYYWGNPNDTEEIICNGKTLSVTWRLRACLRQLRRPEKPMILWADAICIDQHNPRERGHQVMQMGTIYKEASQVLVWLGRGTDFDVGAAFDLVRSLDRALAGLDPGDPLASDRLATFLPNTNREAWMALKGLLKHKWFRRIWVVQEVGLARRASVVCEKYRMSWRTLSTVCVHLAPNLVLLDREELPSPKLSVIPIYEMLLMDFKEERRCEKVRKVLWRGWRSFKSTDPRDKIYALLGHPAFERACQKLSLETLVPIEYAKDPFETFLEAAKRILDLDCNLKLLSYVSHPELDETDSENFISWVPRWDHRATEKSHFDTYDSLYTVLPFSQMQFSTEARFLRIDGTCFDSTEHVSQTFSTKLFLFRESHAEWATRILSDQFVSIWNMLKAKLYHHEEEDLFGILCDTMSAGGARARYHMVPAATAEAERLEDLALYMDSIGIPLCESDQRRRKFGNGGDLWRLRDTTEFCPGRSLFITRKGHVGLGPREMKPGDLVCLFFSARVPFILRPKPERNGYWLIGECYVNGIMQGEAQEMLDSGELKKETFTLV